MLGGCWLTSPPPKKRILLSNIVDMEPSLILSLMGTASKDAACVGLRHRHRQPKKNHPKKTQKK